MPSMKFKTVRRSGYNT